MPAQSTMIPPESVSAALSSFTLIALAEIGDKSQLVCMTLATRHRHWPVLLGATLAFLILNALAVLFGTGIAAWVPERILAGVVAVMFGVFGIHTLLHKDDEESDEIEERPGHGIFYTTLLLILVAEFGDKTQIAVAGLAGSMAPWPVWLGATAALILVTALGVWAGRTLLQRIPLRWLHLLSGGLFMTFALMAAWRALV
ncbi:MAG: TMEM165/GDT1 family protein [Chromatiales bacterium]